MKKTYALLLSAFAIVLLSAAFLFPTDAMASVSAKPIAKVSGAAMKHYAIDGKAAYNIEIDEIHNTIYANGDALVIMGDADAKETTVYID